MSPPARSGAGFAHHPPTKTVMLFGGEGAQGYLADTWLWDDRTWRAVPGGPPARTNASMAYDPITGSIILHGGFDSSLLGDTWKWDGKSWVALSPGVSHVVAHDFVPPQVAGAGFAYSAAAGKLILFGGVTRMMSPGGSRSDTWAWDGKNWSEVSFGSLPPGRAYAAMAADPDGRLTLLFGGAGVVDYLGDTWTLTRSWSEDRRAPAPSPRAGASLAPDPSSNSFLLFGGRASGALMGDTWAWGPY